VEVDHLPVCPHCGKAIEEIHFKSEGALATIDVYMCPHCRRALGVGSSAL